MAITAETKTKFDYPVGTVLSHPTCPDSFLKVIAAQDISECGVCAINPLPPREVDCPTFLTCTRQNRADGLEVILTPCTQSGETL